jgi:signal peptidase I
MLPAIRPADILLIRAVETARVTAGDVILFAREGCLIAHRVVETHAGGQAVITRGDANSHDDDPVTASLVVGRVEGLLRRGAAVPAGPVPSRRIPACVRALVAAARGVSGAVGGATRSTP